MDHEDDETKTVTCKYVSVRSWERAGIYSMKAGEVTGAWVSRAIDQLAAREEGERVLPPEKPQLSQTSTGLPQIMIDPVALLRFMKEVEAPVQKRNVVLLNRLLFQTLTNLTNKKDRAEPVSLDTAEPVSLDTKPALERSEFTQLEAAD